MADEDEVVLLVRMPAEQRKRFKKASIDAGKKYADFLDHLMDRADRLERLEMAMPSLVVQP